MLLGLLGGLDRTRHRPTLVCPRDGRLPESARALGIETRVIGYRGASVWFHPALWARLPATRRVTAGLRESAPEVVYSDFHSLPHVVPACRDLGLPLIFWCLGWWFRPKTWQRSFYRDGPDAILAPCEAVRRGFLGSPAFMSPDRVQVVNPGVDTVTFRPRPADREALRRELDLPSDVPIVTLLARFQVVKGHDVFLDAARLLADRFPTARFVIAGENAFGVSADEAFRRRILGRARSDPVLRERVTFLGWTEHPERLLAASDVLVCSSRFESYGMALVEAMACGLPVVSTQVGGPSETVVDGVTGYLVPPERPGLIADRVAVLLGNPGLRQQMGTQGRRRTEARFESRQYAAAVSAVIESLAAVRDHSPARVAG